MELKAQITALVQKAANADEAERDEPDLDIPAEIERSTARLAAIEAAKARLEERQAAEVVNTSSDVQQLPMVLNAVKSHTGKQADKVLADVRDGMIRG